MPLPRLRPGATDAGWAASYDLTTTVPTDELSLDSRIACLSRLGLAIFQQRFVYSLARVEIALEHFTASTVQYHEEVELLEEWNQDLAHAKIEAGCDPASALTEEAVLTTVSLPSRTYARRSLTRTAAATSGQPCGARSADAFKRTFRERATHRPGRALAGSHGAFAPWGISRTHEYRQRLGVFGSNAAPDYASTRITRVSASTPSWSIASAIAGLSIAAMTASMSATSQHCPAGRVLRVDERPNVRDPEGPEDLLALWRGKPVLGVLHVVMSDHGRHGVSLASRARGLRTLRASIRRHAASPLDVAHIGRLHSSGWNEKRARSS
jgi:hypothetical protein